MAAARESVRRCAALEALVANSDRLLEARLGALRDAEAAAAASAAEAEALRSALPTALAGGLEGVDILYLKNVTIRLLEECGRGRRAEVAVLLPVIATLLQFSAAEFARTSKLVCDAAAERRAAEDGGLGSLARFLPGSLLR